MPWCKACGEEVGDPEEVLHDPDGDLGVVEEGVSNPDSAHIKVVKGEKGIRKQCTKTGQMTKLLPAPPDAMEEAAEKVDNDQAPSGGSSPPKGGGGGKVYDLKEDKSAVDILKEVITNPSYELNEDQINEVTSWSDIYDGRIPPDTLENILKNLSGVSNQKAQLMKQKYEAMLQKWMQEQSQDDGGPPLGAMAPPPSAQPSGNRPSPQPERRSPDPARNHPPRNKPEEEMKEEEEEEEDPISSMRGERREKRVERRQEAIDMMAEEMARNMAQDAGQFYSDMRDIMTTLVKKKAERDPEWFFEKADAFGFDILDELAEPSQAKQQEMNKPKQSSADRDIDKALENLGEGSPEPSGSPEPQQRQPEPRQQERKPEPQPEPEPTQKPKEGAEPHANANPMSAAPQDSPEEPEDEEFEDEGDAFEELMGDVAE